MKVEIDLAGKTALVTGSTRGIGAAIAAGLAAHGAHVVINGRGAEAVAGRVEEMRTGGHAVSGAAFDVGDREAARAATEELLETHGRIDILVNNAGIIHRAELADFTDEDFEAVTAVNLTGGFALARDLSAGMAEAGWGRIVNIGSIMSHVARPTIPAYVASKHAIAGLTKALAVELGPKGVTCNAVSPGYIDTELNAPLIADEVFDRMVRERTPAGRWGRVDEIAAAVVFLCSDAAGYVNGISLLVDGGMTAALY